LHFLIGGEQLRRRRDGQVALHVRRVELEERLFVVTVIVIRRRRREGKRWSTTLNQAATVAPKWRYPADRFRSPWRLRAVELHAATQVAKLTVLWMARALFQHLAGRCGEPALPKIQA
jgi:hypothetical protein